MTDKQPIVGQDMVVSVTFQAKTSKYSMTCYVVWEGLPEPYAVMVVDDSLFVPGTISITKIQEQQEDGSWRVDRKVDFVYREEWAGHIEAFSSLSAATHFIQKRWS